ncbi:hypothetical protein [Spirosoma lituiforme]
MRQSVLIMSVILAGLFLFSGFCWVLIDWCQAIQQDRHKHEPLNLIVESLTIMVYGYLGFRFLQARLPGSQPPDH